MDATLSNLVEPLKGPQSAGIAVALSVGLLLLTVLQYASMPKKSVPASVPLKIEAVGLQPPNWNAIPSYTRLDHWSVLMAFDSYTSIP